MTTNLSSTTSLFDRMQVGVMLLVAVFFAGCVHTPANRAAVDNNILTKPIHIELPIGGTNPSAKKFDEYFDIVTYDRSYLIDDISRKKVREIAEGLYPEYCKVRDEILTEAGKQNNMVKIREALTNTFTKNDLSYARQMGFGNSINTVFSESEITLNKETQGRTDCHILLYGDNFKTKSTPSVDINIDLNYNVLEDRIIVDVTGIRYNSNRLNVRSEILVKAIEDTTPPTAITPNKYYFAGKINDQLKVRYSSKHANTSKTVRTYKVDLATAKARIQRAFGNSYDVDFSSAEARRKRENDQFKSNSDKTAFIFEKSYNNPLGRDSVTHRFVISLFPERNDTLVEFSGDYGYYLDTFGGPDKFTKAEYDISMSGYISTIDEILKK